jgi:isoquinoline 1-oxidoreductase beta subunit
MLIRKNDALPIATINPSRRAFLKAGIVAGAGLVIGWHLPSGRITSAQAAEAGSPFEGYIRISPENKVTVLAAHLDMGQGIYTGTATLVAEELEADLSQMEVEGGYGNVKLYGNLAFGGAMQGTGGSTATMSSFDRYRKAGAMARVMLVNAAAKQWTVPAGEITVSKGVVSHSSGKKATFGELAEAAAKETPPAEVTLKDAGAWTLIGNADLRRLDSPAKTTGRQQFTLDVKLPGMLYAVIQRPPLFGGKVKSFDATAAKQVKGVVDVVEIPRGVAVVADSTWNAMQGRNALKVEWDDAAAEKRGTTELMAEYKKLAASGEGAAVARNDGDAAAAMKSATKIVTSEFEFPYLAHAAMEPLDAVARKERDVIEIWGGHQMPDLYQAIAAQIAGTTPDKITLHVMMTGGSFGRRAVGDGDVIAEAVSTAKAIGWKAPVKVVWTREDDMTGGRYRPMYFHKLQAGLDGQGKLVAWQHRIVGQSIMADGPFAGMIKNGVDPTSVEGASTLPYGIKNVNVDLITTKVGVPVLWWRSVGSTHTAYSTEVLIDELAQAAGKDPIEFRLSMLGDKPRHKAVLEKVKEVSGWGQALEKGKGRGVAVAESFGSYVAQVVDVSVDQGSIKVERVICAVDCGTAVNPDVIKAQMEGGIGYGLSAILKGEITLKDGMVEQNNFDGYEVLHLDEMPQVEVHILPSKEGPTGVGEPGVPPIGPAVANAVFAATGKRIRVLPMSKFDWTAA